MQEIYPTGKVTKCNTYRFEDNIKLGVFGGGVNRTERSPSNNKSET